MKKILIFLFCVSCVLNNALGVVHDLVSLSDINIAKGEKIDFASVINGVSIAGETGEVVVNFPDTSILADGIHQLVFTVLTFSGKSSTRTVNLTVGNGGNLTGVPQFTNISNVTFKKGSMLNLKKDVIALDSSGENIQYSTNIRFPEHLSEGLHKIYYTAIDKSGKSAVQSCEVTVESVTDKLRKVQWARLGDFLYTKYFEPSRLTPYMKTDSNGNITSKIIKTFSYSPVLNAVTAEIFYNDIKYDQLAFPVSPIKLESLMARMFLLLNELQHNRFLWIDKSMIVVQVAMRGSIDRSGVSENTYFKDRGFHSIRIPVSIFKKKNFITYIFKAFNDLATLPTVIKRRNDGKGYIVHKLLDGKDDNITILFIEDMREDYYPHFKADFKSGIITLEENVDLNMLQDEFDSNWERFENMDFGRFTEPALP
jgi:hypothetical protein